MDLKSVTEGEIRRYAVEGVNVRVIFSMTLNDEFILTAYANENGLYKTYTALYAALIGERVVIYEDRTDPSLAETLMQAGVPRDKLVLVYRGEPAPARTP